jgi:hypothetical protein
MSPRPNSQFIKAGRHISADNQWRREPLGQRSARRHYANGRQAEPSSAHTNGRIGFKRGGGLATRKATHNKAITPSDL